MQFGETYTTKLNTIIGQQVFLWSRISPKNVKEVYQKRRNFLQSFQLQPPVLHQTVSFFDALIFFDIVGKTFVLAKYFYVIYNDRWYFFTIIIHITINTFCG